MILSRQNFIWRKFSVKGFFCICINLVVYVLSQSILCIQCGEVALFPLCEHTCESCRTMWTYLWMLLHQDLSWFLLSGKPLSVAFVGSWHSSSFSLRRAVKCCDSLSLPSFLGRKEHEKCEFEVHEVYAIDILVSTGEGKVNSLSLAHSLSPHRSLFVSLCHSLSLLSFPSPSFLFPTATSNCLL